MSALKILHVVPSLSSRGGGPSESVPMTAMAQLNAGLEVAIAFYDSEEISLKAKEAEQAGVRLIRFIGARTRHNPIAFSWDLVRRFEDVAKDYDVVHTHCQWMFPIWWAGHVAKKLGKRLYLMPRGSFAPARLQEAAWKKRLVGGLDRHYARQATAVWATAESEAAEVRAYVPGVKTEVFPIGLALGRAEGQQVKVKGEGEARTLLYFSRISPIKGLDLLAEAWARLCREVEVEGGGGDRWKLLLVGPDDRGYRAEIEKVFTEKCPAGSFEFRGPVFGAEKRELLARADAFVLPTRNENWGIAVAEAMASGLPCIVTKGAPWSCLASSHAGWWCEVSVEGLEGALRELMALSDAECVAMGANGRKWVEENLDWAKIGARMKAAYEREVTV